MTVETEEQTEQTIKDIEAAEEQEFSDAFAEASSARGESDSEEEPEGEPESIDDEEPEQETVTDLDDIEALRKERDNYRHQFESNKGRVSAYQQQINSLQTQLASYVQQGGSKEQAQEELAKEVNDSSWEELKEDFPEIAKAVENKLSSINQRVDEMVGQRIGQIEQQIQPLAQQADEAALGREYAALEAAHPDYQTIADSSEFAQWLGQKPEPVQRMIESNSAADAAYLLDTFKAESGQRSEQRRSQNQQQNRQRLELNVAVPSTRTKRREVSDDDFSSAFASAAAKHDRNLRR